MALNAMTVLFPMLFEVSRFSVPEAHAQSKSVNPNHAHHLLQITQSRCASNHAHTTPCQAPKHHGIWLVLVNRPVLPCRTKRASCQPPSFQSGLLRPSPTSPVFPGGTSGFCPTNHGSSQPQKASTPPQRAVPAHFFCARHGTLYGNTKSSSNQLHKTGRSILFTNRVHVLMVLHAFFALRLDREDYARRNARIGIVYELFFFFFFLFLPFSFPFLLQKQYYLRIDVFCMGYRHAYSIPTFRFLQLVFFCVQ
ncbi:hypothetical protein GGI43DRAFT_213532 [Trichoderma evansii]